MHLRVDTQLAEEVEEILHVVYSSKNQDQSSFPLCHVVRLIVPPVDRMMMKVSATALP